MKQFLNIKPGTSSVLQPYDGLPQQLPSDEQVLVSAEPSALHAQLLLNELLQPQASGCSTQHECQSFSHQTHESEGWKQQTVV